MYNEKAKTCFMSLFSSLKSQAHTPLLAAEATTAYLSVMSEYCFPFSNTFSPPLKIVSNVGAWSQKW